MELNPEDVKAELAAVKIACDQVNARLDRSRAKAGGSRPNILSRISKAVNPLEANRQQPPVRSYADYDRRSSRRFVNRDWNIARKRTAEGLFVDDQEDGEGGEEEDTGPPRKRTHTQDPALQKGKDESNKSAEGTALQAERQDTRTQYNPYAEAKQPVGGLARLSQTDVALNRRRVDPGSVTTKRGFDKSRISFASSAQQQENGQPSGTRRVIRAHNSHAMHEQPRDGLRRDAAEGLHGDGAHRDPDHGPDRNGAGGHMEDGEVETLPAAPPPAEEFVVERRPERPAPVPDKVQQRNRRMFGALLGHLDAAERQEKKFEQSSVLKRRKELEQHAAERARLDSIQARQAERSRIFEARRKDIATKRELLLQQNMKQAKLLCAERIAYARSLLRFIRTETIPPILWEPAGVNPDVEQLFEQQAGDFESWAEEQLDKLRLDQQGMRERAEKQWATIDRIREERHKANLGRWKSAREPAKPAPKAVRSSVMTAKDYRDRAQRMQQPDAARAEEPGQPGNEDELENAAADEAEANDEAYLVPDADKAAPEAADAPAEELPRIDHHSPTLDRHAGPDEAAASGDEETAAGQTGRGRDGPPEAANENAASTHTEAAKAGGPEEENSEDSLSLSE